MNANGFGDFENDAFNTTNQFGTPGGEAKPRRIQSVVNVTAKEIKDSDSNTLFIDGQEVHMIAIVGIVQDVQIASTKVTYIINDGTACIEAAKWNEDGKSETLHRPLMENTYCRIVGSIKTLQGQNYILVFAIHEITDLNMITKHMLENIFYKLNMQAYEKISSGDVDAAIGGGFQKDALPATSSDKSAPNNRGFTAHQNMVYSLIQLATTDAGCDRDTLYRGLKGKVSTGTIDETLDFLCGEGHTYTTVDDDHFKTTDM